MPCEANPPLRVDANAVLPFMLSVQRLKMIAGRNSERFKIHYGIKHIQLAQGSAFDCAELPACAFGFQLPRLLAFVARDHDLLLFKS